MGLNPDDYSLAWVGTHLQPRVYSHPMTKRDERRAQWRADLERLAKDLGRKLEPWQLDVAAEIFVSRLPKASVTGRGDIAGAAHLAAQRVGADMVADGRLNDTGNWPAGHPRVEEYYAHYFPNAVRPDAD